MDDRITIRRLDDPEWRRLLETDSPFFLRPSWLELLGVGLRGEARIVCLERDGAPCVAMPAFLLRAGPFRILYAGIPYGGLAGDPGAFPAFWRAIDRRPRALGADQLRFVPYGSEEPGPSRSRVRRTTIVTLDLRGLDAKRYRDGLPSSVRGRIRKARRDGIAIRGGGSGDDFHPLYVRAMERNRAAVKYPPPYFRALADRGEILLAHRDGSPVAGIALVEAGGGVHYLHGGSRDEALTTGANDLLFFEAISTAIRAGHREFDFGPSDPEDEGLLHFKRKWGGVARNGPVFVAPLRPVRSALSEAARSLVAGRAGRWLGRRR